MDGKFAGVGVIAAIAGGAFAIGGPEQGETYNISQAQAATMLVNAPLNESLDEAMSKGRISLHVRAKPDHSQVVWTIGALGQSLATVTADLEPKGTGTRAIVNFALADGSMADAARADLGEGVEMVEATFELAMAEHVDSVLEKRPFNDKKFTARIAGYAASNPETFKKYVKRRQEAENEGAPSAFQEEVERQMQADAEWHADMPGDRRMPNRGHDEASLSDDWGS